jgi:hypothetical protein
MKNLFAIVVLLFSSTSFGGKPFIGMEIVSASFGGIFDTILDVAGNITEKCSENQLACTVINTPDWLGINNQPNGLLFKYKCFANIVYKNSTVIPHYFFESQVFLQHKESHQILCPINRI